MSSIQNTSWKDLSNINNLFELYFPDATLEMFTFLNLFLWNNINASYGAHEVPIFIFEEAQNIKNYIVLFYKRYSTVKS